MDREKLIRGLNCCAHTDGANCIYCPYNITGEDCTAHMSMDVLDLLKEKEPKEVILKNLSAYCPWCSTEETIKMGVQKLHLGTHYCPYCGQAVKWE